MPFLPQNIDLLIDKTVSRFSAKTSITDFGPGSKIRTILELLYEDLDNLQTEFSINQANNFLSGASDTALDALGILFGVPRLEANRVFIGSGSKNFKFYTIANNFGAINDGVSITIPANTRIFSSEDTNKSYRTVETIILPAAGNDVYFSASADFNGDSANIGPNQVDSHDFVGYADISNASLLVTNINPITLGNNRESDSEYRFRIVESIKSLQKGNALALRLDLLSLPGIADVLFEDRAYGIGTARLVLQSDTAVVDQTVLDYAQQAIRLQTPVGVRIYIERPETLEVSLKVTVNFRPGVSTGQKDLTIQSVYSKIVSYINNLPINAPLTINRLASEIIAVDPNNILSIGKPNQFFDYIYVYKTTRVGQVRREVFSDLFVPEGIATKFIVATFIDPAITVV